MINFFPTPNNIPTDYKLKTIPEDFIVKEVSLEPELSPKEESQFTYFLLKKIGLSTFNALEKIADYFNLSYQDVSSQGLKDEDGITFQTISVKKIVLQNDLILFNKLYIEKDYLIKLENIIGYGKQEVKIALLHGNVFNLIIRNLTNDEAKSFNSYFYSKKLVSFINYYDSQRFGVIGNQLNTHMIGENMVEGNWEEAYRQLIASGNLDKNAKKLEEIGIIDNIKNFFRQINPTKVRFFISSYNSWLWNKGLNDYIKKQRGSKKNNFSLLGELFLLSNYNSELKNIFTSPGYRINMDNFLVSNKNCSRSIIVNTKMFILSTASDEIYQGKEKINISFFLPAGSYATMFVSQMFWQLNNYK